MPRFRRTSLIACTAALSLAALGGCSGDKDEPESTGGSAGRAATGGSAGSAAPAPVATADPDKVIARQTFKLRARPEDTVEVGVVSLVVAGKVARLDLVVTPRFKSQPAGEAISLYEITERSTFQPYLLDMANLKRYDVVKSGARGLSSEDVDTKTVNGTSMSVYAVFATPQDGATAIDFHFAGWWPAFKAVPVQR